MRLPNLPEVLLEDVLGREDSLSDALVGVVEGNLETISDGPYISCKYESVCNINNLGWNSRYGPM